MTKSEICDSKYQRLFLGIADVTARKSHVSCRNQSILSESSDLVSSCSWYMYRLQVLCKCRSRSMACRHGLFNHKHSLDHSYESYIEGIKHSITYFDKSPFLTLAPLISSLKTRRKVVINCFAISDHNDVQPSRMPLPEHISIETHSSVNKRRGMVPYLPKIHIW